MSKLFYSNINLQIRMLLRNKRTVNIIISLIAPVIYIALIYVKQRPSDLVLGALYMLPYIFYCPLAFSWDSSYFSSIILLPNSTDIYIKTKIITPIIINISILIMTLPILFYDVFDILFILSSNVFFISLYSFFGIFMATTNKKYIDLTKSRSKNFDNFTIIQFAIVLFYIATYIIPIILFTELQIKSAINYFFIASSIASLLLSKLWIKSTIIKFQKNKLLMFKMFTNDRY